MANTNGTTGTTGAIGTIASAQQQIDRLVTALAGEGAGPRTRRKLRRFIGVAGLIAANVWLGGWIGHGVAALLGAGFFFLVAFYDGEGA